MLLRLIDLNTDDLFVVKTQCLFLLERGDEELNPLIVPESVEHETEHLLNQDSFSFAIFTCRKYLSLIKMAVFHIL